MFSGFEERERVDNRNVNMYKGCVLGDTGAGASIFWDKSLLKNIRRIDKPFSIVGIGGSRINVYYVGDSVFGPVG